MELPHEKHDVVVIGAGPSGCALVSALVREGLQVLLLEAGDADAYKNPSSAFIGKWITACLSRNALPYETAPQAGINGRKIKAWRGVGGGGCTLVNAGLYMRGRREDYEDWPWPIAEIEHSFRRVERHMGVECQPSMGVGALQCDMFKQAGVPEMKESEGEDSPGWVSDGIQRNMWVTAEAESARRITAWQGMVRPLLTMPNLTVLDWTSVRKLLFDDGGACIGLACLRRGWRAPQVLRVAKGAEVVLCGGALNTPKLLMLSGVGPAAHLAEMRVPLVRDVPAVGENLQDHAVFYTNNKSAGPMTNKLFLPSNVHGAVHMQLEGRKMHFLISDSGDAHKKLAPILSTITNKEGWFWAIVTTLLRWFFALMSALPPVCRFMESTIGCTICIVDPAARGRVRLRSSDPRAYPVFDAGLLNNETDWKVARAAYLEMLRVQSTTELGLEWFGVQLSPGAMYKFGTKEEDFRAFVRSFCFSYFHYVGSCSMGLQGSKSGGSGDSGGGSSGSSGSNGNGSSAAVDPETLLVKGLRNVHVADCSVAPRIPCVPTQAMALMIGDMTGRILLRSDALRKRAKERVAAAALR